MFSEARNIFLILKVTSKISTIDVDIKYIKINLNIQIERAKTETFYTNAMINCVEKESFGRSVSSSLMHCFLSVSSWSVSWCK